RLAETSGQDLGHVRDPRLDDLLHPRGRPDVDVGFLDDPQGPEGPLRDHVPPEGLPEGMTVTSPRGCALCGACWWDSCLSSAAERTASSCPPSAPPAAARREPSRP